MLRQFRVPIVFALVCLALGAWYGWSMGGTLAAVGKVLWIVIVLSILELSLSFDNAVVNATVLKGMDQVWRKRFLTWGMVFAVYGMYIVFPLAIVAIAAGLGPMEAVRLSLSDPARYEQLVSGAHTGIAGFGGAFLAMVGLKFFFDEEKDLHWIDAIEAKLARFAVLPAIEIVAVLLIAVIISSGMPTAQALTFLTSAVLGITTFIVVNGVGNILQQREEASKISGAAVHAGLGGFIYLNVLDATFSFDAVIGAFALSNNMVVIALGLSIGAMFVRTMTLVLVEQGTLSQYRFLEHGAFWAILALGAIMLLSVRIEIPDALTGLVGAVLIGLALWRSIRMNRKEQVD
jgi:hypothetical protein